MNKYLVTSRTGGSYCTDTIKAAGFRHENGMIVLFKESGKDFYWIVLHNMISIELKG